MLTVGLTGSIAVGKSFVCQCLSDLGCRVLDADETAREVVVPGTRGLKAIVSAFGDEILAPDGTLDRKKLGAIVFANTQKLTLLNSIVHPLVIEAQDEWIAELERDDPNSIAVIDAALMIESGGYKRFNKLIVVWCNTAIQLDRLMLRDRLNEADARARISAQMPQEEKKQFADFLIDTTGGFDATREQVRDLYQQLLTVGRSER